jgi:hypothetical protein
MASTGYGVQSYAQNITDKIIGDYQTLRTAEYAVGEGLRAEKYLIGFTDKDGKYYFIDTENIISPALFLKDKVAAATQAQFDLAQMAFKQNPEGPFGSEETCPDPKATGDVSLNEGQQLKDIIDPKDLQHGWYMATITPTTGDPYKVCIFPQFNDITGTVFTEIRRQPSINIDQIKELPAPWEDTGSYMAIPKEYTTWFEGTTADGLTGEQAGLVKAPPAFNLQEYATQYPDLTAPEAYPNIYGAAYGTNTGLAMPVSENYYTNKWYKGITQLYEKPMSEILKTWFKYEE